MRPFDQFIVRTIRHFQWGPVPRRQRRVGEDLEPSVEPAGSARIAAAVGAAVVLPVVTGFLLVPVRGTLDHSVSLLMLLPVLVVAAVGGRRPGVIAALVAAVTFDVLLTEPYFRLVIDDPDDVTAAVILLIAGVVTGTFVSAMSELTARSQTRRDELEHLRGFILESVGAASGEEMIEAARLHLLDLLSLEDCRWHPGFRGGGGPQLGVDGGVRLFGSADTADVRRLPDHLEIPVALGARVVGAYIARPNRGPVSREERRAAGAIAVHLAHELVRGR